MCAPPPGFDDVSHLPGTQGDAHNSDGKRTRQIPCKKMVVARLKGEKEGREKKKKWADPLRFAGEMVSKAQELSVFLQGVSRREC